MAAPQWFIVKAVDLHPASRGRFVCHGLNPSLPTPTPVLQSALQPVELELCCVKLGDGHLLGLGTAPSGSLLVPSVGLGGALAAPLPWRA